MNKCPAWRVDDVAIVNVDGNFVDVAGVAGV